MGEIQWTIERIDRDNGDIDYEVQSITEGAEPEEESFITFEGFNAKRDAENFIKGMALIGRTDQQRGDE